MSTCVEVDVSDLTDFEFAKPCDFFEGCDEAAVALYQRSHTTEGCWGPPVYFCQHHLTESLRRYGEWLSRYGLCAVCNKQVHGALSQNTKTVWL